MDRNTIKAVDINKPKQKLETPSVVGWTDYVVYGDKYLSQSTFINMQSPIPIIIWLLKWLSRAAKQYEMMLDLKSYTDKTLSKRLSHKRPHKRAIMPHQRACHPATQVPCHFKMTSPNGNILRVTGHLCGSPVNSPHKGQWRGALMFSLICVWINDWVNNREAGDLRRYRAHHDVIVMWNLQLSDLQLRCTVSRTRHQDRS